MLSAVVAVVCFLAAAPRQAPQFRAGVELVTVDARVVGPDGEPIVDLRPEDFVVKVDGKPRALKSLNLLRVGGGPVTAPAAPTPGAPAPGAAAAAPPPASRTLILVFDHEHIRTTNERIAVDGAIKALNAIAPGDRVALVTLPNGKIEVNLTTDVEPVRRALRMIVGRATDLVYGTVTPGVTCVLPVLREFLGGLKRIPGPKTIVLVSEGFTCELRRSRMDYRMDFEDLAKAAAAVRAQFYVLQPNTGMVIDANRRLPAGVRDGEQQQRDESLKNLEDIAGVTGGDLFRLSGTADAVFERVIRETSAYYELAFEPLDSERNGKEHSISVRVNRPKATVRARPSFAIPKAR